MYKIAIFNDITDIRKDVFFRGMVKKYKVVWITERFYQKHPEGNITFIRAEYPNKDIKSTYLKKLVFELYKLAGNIFPRILLHRLPEMPKFNHKVLENVDFYFSDSDYSLFYALVLRKKYGYKFKVLFHDAETLPFLNHRHALSKYIWKIINKEVDMFIPWANIIRNKEMIEGVEPDRIKVIYHPVDSGIFHPSDVSKILADKYRKNKRRIILTVGKIEVNKGIKYALLADKILKKESYKFVHLYISDGKKLEYYKKYAKHLGLEEHSLFLGNIPFKNLNEYYNLADVFVLPSISTRTREEQFGRAIVESMMCETPVV